MAAVSYSLEDRLKEENDENRVLTIQSHVVHGYAGNKCSVFPLQLHGFEVDIINSVQFSTHTGYESHNVSNVKGQRLTDKDLDDLFEGLRMHNVHKYSHVLTGYCGDPSFLRSIAHVVSESKKVNPNLIYVCDPYTPKTLLPVYQDVILPLVDILTPNLFELTELTGRAIENEKDCLAAIKELHESKGIRIIVVTSGMFTENRELMYCYASERKSPNKYVQYRFEIPVIKGVFVGTGDVFTSLLVVWHTMTRGSNPNPNAALREIRLVQSRYDLLVPKGDSILWSELE